LADDDFFSSALVGGLDKKKENFVNFVKKEIFS